MITEKELVKCLGDQIGYGRTMQLCEEIWREKGAATGLKGSEHTTGPCAYFMVPCPHPIKDEMENCELCRGAGRITKGTLQLVSDIAELKELAEKFTPGFIDFYEGFKEDQAIRLMEEQGNYYKKVDNEEKN